MVFLCAAIATFQRCARLRPEVLRRFAGPVFNFSHFPRPIRVRPELWIARMRTVAFNWRGDLESSFPPWLWHPRVYQTFDIAVIDRVGYRIYDSWLGARLGACLARAYRCVRPNRYETT